jgi:hypothetical protein
MEDLRGFTRDLARRMEVDLGTRLDWVAVDHWNTDNPHVHLIVRGVDDRGGDLVIARDYISSGLRSRAEDLVALELGPKPENEIRHALEREVTAERWTRLDRELRHHADDLGLLDLRPSAPGPEDPQIRRLMVGRLQHLRKLGLASEGRPGDWMMGLEAERTLRDLGERGDIIKTMHHAFAERGQDRGFSNFSIDGGGAGDPIIGRLEQRIGRIKRFGQAREKVDMLNLVNEQTVDEKVYDRLSERMRDRFDLFGSLPDTIRDDWIDNIETLGEKMDEYINAQREATGFDLRYNATAEPSDLDWRECTEVLSRRDFARLMSCGWT